MAIQIQKAVRSKSKLRLGLASPSGGGKTYSALVLAKGLTSDGTLEKVCVIDTESGSANLYAHLGDYSTIQLDPQKVTSEVVIESFTAAEEAGFEVIIFDSSSMWREWLLEQNDKVAQQMYNNSFAAWRKTNKYYDAVIKKFLASPCHVIITSRKKQEYVVGQDDRGKSTVTKLGLKDVQRDGLEYELTTVFNLDMNHLATATKDRTGIFMDAEPFLITEETGKIFKEWCETGAEPTLPKVSTPTKVSESTKTPITDERLEKAAEAIKSKQISVQDFLSKFELTDEQKVTLKNLLGSN